MWQREEGDFSIEKERMLGTESHHKMKLTSV